MTYRKQYKYVS